MPKLTERARVALISDGPVLAGRLSYRQDYISALTAGRTAFEVQKDLKGEIDQVWEEVKKLATRQPSMSTKERAHG